jgi:ammonia channel protein AmtB
MKHILPILTLTTLAAAASAQAASGLSYNNLSLVYTFKGVVAGVDVTPYVGTEDTYGVLLRRTLSEVVAGLEVRAAYEQTQSEANADNSAVLVGLGYSFAKSYTVDVNYINAEGAGADSWQVGLRYNF